MSMKRASCLGCLTMAFVSALIGFLLVVAMGAFQISQAQAADCGGTGAAGGSGGGSTVDTLTADQINNAKAIIGVGKGKGIPVYGQLIAVTTAIGESNLVVLDHGDAAGPDSRGLFQQRTSWGPLSVRMDPAGSANLFYNALLRVSGWEQMTVTQAAHTVQVNQDPNYYTKYVAEGQAILAKYGDAPAVVMSGPTYGGGTSTAGGPAGGCAGGYVNPIKNGWYAPARIDQGTDWLPSAATVPVIAIGNAQITYAQSSGTGWPRHSERPFDNAGGCVVYKLLDGRLAGKYIYVCEDVDPVVTVGQKVAAGQTIANAHYDPPNGCCWTEWGWASGAGPSPLTPYTSTDPNGYCTPGGIAFARLIHNIGGPWATVGVCPQPAGSFGAQPEYP
jgi:hypothetical protein